MNKHIFIATLSMLSFESMFPTKMGVETKLEPEVVQTYIDSTTAAPSAPPLLLYEEHKIPPRIESIEPRVQQETIQQQPQEESDKPMCCTRFATKLAIWMDKRSERRKARREDCRKGCNILMKTQTCTKLSSIFKCSCLSSCCCELQKPTCPKCPPSTCTCPKMECCDNISCSSFCCCCPKLKECFNDPCGGCIECFCTIPILILLCIVGPGSFIHG